MKSRKPKLVAIERDDYHAEHIGWTSDGRQFFLTTPFEPSSDTRPGAEFVALFIFDAKGKLLESKIDDFGPRESLDDSKRRECYESRLKDLGEVQFERIEVKPFAIERFGTTFGLVAVKPEDEDDEWVVEMQPGNYMAFFEPWDSGDYDT